MCGISGFVGSPLPAAAVDAVRSMNQAMARRGPDGEGRHAWSHAVLGHRRLAIFDLSDAGRQPMLSADGQVGVVFNGAIFNFRDLRAELEAHGHQFHSQTDTEVLVEGYRAWGLEQLVRRLRGMYAFALWDDVRETLWLVRDRLGVKPLLYKTSGATLAFASTVTALHEAGMAGDIDPHAVVEFLEFGFVTEQRAIFQGIRKLPPGGIVEWHHGRLKEWTYWTLPHVEEKAPIGFEEAVAETERLLLESVRLRLEADVPVGCLLSGGVDSALVCWAVAQFNPKLTAFTIGTQGHAADETAAARETAQLLGIPHQVLELSPDRPALFDELIEAYGEPFACSSALGMISISQVIKPHATVLLTGDGGDDVFLGYRTHRVFLHAQRLARMLPDPVANFWGVARPAVDRFPTLRRFKHLMDYTREGVGAVYRVHDGLPFYRQLGILGPRVASLELRHRVIPPSRESARHLLWEFLSWEQQNRFVSEFLTKVDGGAMYHALEARSPFLDQHMWEFASRLPFSIRLSGGEPKAVLRELVRRRVGPIVASRPKQGFTIPVEDWMLVRWRPRLRELAEHPLLEQEGWLRPGGLRRAIDAAEQRGRAPVQLWSLAVLESWLRALAQRQRVHALAG
jgi:asparagine synthase (glutamine-hydrolysing)